MKKLLIVTSLLIAIVAQGQLVISTNAPSSAAAQPLLSSRAHIDSITLIGTNATTVQFFDQVTTAPYYGTNYVVSSYVSKQSYASNAVVSSQVDAYGNTNWYTNSGIYTLLVTNAAATNRLTPIGVFSVGANQAVTYDVDILCPRGISIYTPTYGVGVTVTYRP